MNDPYQVMPPLSPDEYEAMKADIEAHGVLVPVTVDQHGNILDGHHRKQIAEQLKVPYDRLVRVCDSAGEARDLAFELNLSRRHLPREQKRQLIVVELERNPDDSDRAIARRLHCDHKTVGAVRRELRGEIPHQKAMSFDEAKRRSEQIGASLRDMGTVVMDMLFDDCSPAAIAMCIQNVREQFIAERGHLVDDYGGRSSVDEMLFGGWLDDMAGAQAVFGDTPWRYDDPDWRAWLERWGHARPNELRDSTSRWLQATAPPTLEGAIA